MARFITLFSILIALCGATNVAAQSRSEVDVLDLNQIQSGVNNIQKLNIGNAKNNGQSNVTVDNVTQNQSGFSNKQRLNIGNANSGSANVTVGGKVTQTQTGGFGVQTLNIGNTGEIIDGEEISSSFTDFLNTIKASISNNNDLLETLNFINSVFSDTLEALIEIEKKFDKEIKVLRRIERAMPGLDIINFAYIVYKIATAEEEDRLRVAVREILTEILSSVAQKTLVKFIATELSASCAEAAPACFLVAYVAGGILADAYIVEPLVGMIEDPIVDFLSDLFSKLGLTVFNFRALPYSNNYPGFSPAFLNGQLTFSRAIRLSIQPRLALQTTHYSA
jgi:hypothetical protein